MPRFKLGCDSNNLKLWWCWMNGLMTCSQNYKHAKPPQSHDENSDTWHSVHSYDRLQAAVIAHTHTHLYLSQSQPLFGPPVCTMLPWLWRPRPILHPSVPRRPLPVTEPSSTHIFLHLSLPVWQLLTSVLSQCKVWPYRGCLGMFYKQEPFSWSFGRLLFQIFQFGEGAFQTIARIVLPVMIV